MTDFFKVLILHHEDDTEVLDRIISSYKETITFDYIVGVIPINTQDLATAYIDTVKALSVNWPAEPELENTSSVKLFFYIGPSEAYQAYQFAKSLGVFNKVYAFTIQNQKIIPFRLH